MKIIYEKIGKIVGVKKSAQQSCWKNQKVKLNRQTCDLSPSFGARGGSRTTNSDSAEIVSGYLDYGKLPLAQPFC